MLYAPPIIIGRATLLRSFVGPRLVLAIGGLQGNLLYAAGRRRCNFLDFGKTIEFEAQRCCFTDPRLPI